MNTGRQAPASNDATFMLLNDAPYSESHDPLDFDDLARGLADLIRDSIGSTPFTLGVQAPWGMGKSTLMHKLRRQLDGDGQTRTVSFNAWTFEGEDVLEGLVKSVLEEIDPSFLRRTLRNKKVVSTLQIAANLVLGWLCIRVDSLVERLWSAVSIDPGTRNQVQSLIAETMQAWIAKTPKGMRDRLLVVFIDDLDRCSPQNVFKIFEAIKLYLDAPGFVFVIGFDQGIVAESILEQKKYSKRVTGGQYIEKIIQIDYSIPRPTEEQIRRLFQEYVRRSNTTALLGSTEETLVVERSDYNPRRIKRFINRFILEHKLVEGSTALRAELLVKTLLLQMYFREFYALFRPQDEPKKNVIAEFLDYLEVRTFLKRGDAANPLVQNVFQFYEIRLPANPEESLKVLEAAVPEAFPDLAQNKDFVELVRGLADPNDQQVVVDWILQKRRMEDVGSKVEADQEAAAPGAAPASLEGLRVLWIDDHPENNASLIEYIRRSGGRVETAVDGESAAKLISWANVLISDVGRRGRSQAGFEDYQKFKEQGYNGPAIFYTGRVTPQLRQKAEEMKAHGITNMAQALVGMLQTLAETERDKAIKAA